MPDISRIEPILSRLVAFETVAGHSNLELIDWVRDVLQGIGFAVTVVPSQDGEKAGILAKIGEGDRGILFSAHTDVVPVEGQDWTAAPFALSRAGDRYVGRGTTDMKGFIACVLSLAETFRDAPPARPVMIALSWDEELGCRGIPEMIDAVIPTLGRPDLCIIGEPTSLRIVTGHKGKASYRAIMRGEAGHSAMAPYFHNALHDAAQFVLALRDLQTDLAGDGARDAAFDPPYSTVHAGVMRGGVAVNIVPDTAEVVFEIRHLAEEDPAEILARIPLLEGAQVTRLGQYPGLGGEVSSPLLERLSGMLDDPAPTTVAFGTEAGYFAALGLPTIVFGPGTMQDGHQPDESIAIDQLTRYLDLITRLVRS